MTREEILGHYNNNAKVIIPKSVKNFLNRVPAKELAPIAKSRTLAVDKVALFIGQLRGGYINYYKTGVFTYSNLNKKSLEKLLGNANSVNKIIKLLTSSGFLEVNSKYSTATFSKSYKLTDKALAKGITTYTLTNPKSLELTEKAMVEGFNTAMTNLIASTQILTSFNMVTPTIEEVVIRGAQLVEDKATSKGRLIKRLGKHSKSEYGTTKERTEKYLFIEDSIATFELLFPGGKPMIPIIGDDKSGGRVYTSYNLCPTWIRNMFTINGSPIVERDYSALHPNMAIAKYSTVGTTHEMYSHDEAAIIANVPRQVAKIEGLSFLNKKVEPMQKSPLWSTFSELYPDVLRNIVAEKKSSPNGHKVTSMNMFKWEVELMTKNIEDLVAIGLGDKLVYVFDAIYVPADYAEITKDIMNKNSTALGYKTKV